LTIAAAPDINVEVPRLRAKGKVNEKLSRKGLRREIIVMRLIKAFGLVAMAAIAAMAMLGAASAVASENTSLCKIHQEPCAEANRAKTVHFVAGTTVLKTSILTVLCLSSLVKGEVEGTGLATAPNPLGVKVTELLWNNCGSNTEHNNCEVKNLKLPLFDVLKTALNLGTAIALGPEVLVKCGESLHCVYGGKEVKGFTVEGALHTTGAGHGMFTATELEVPFVSGFLCPSVSKWTALYEPLEHLFITG
jgi:hypothetical protein